ncbi:MAG TPA: endonuclease III [Candidatus Binataceae bacterium]|nr:endonuclease III [Candidatus Binataceae bacterium]
MKQPSSGTPRTPGEVSRAPITGGKIGAIVRALRLEAPAWNAPIVSFISIQTRDPFKTLISCILSLRTKDQTTAVAAQRLFERAATPEEIATIGERELERLIYPVGFYRTKAKVIRGICRDLLEHHGGVVPGEIDALLKLKGVGRKTANLVVTQAYGKPGICVDTHVHRISNRWGLVATRTPDKTEMALREILPRRHWLEYNGLLVAFGQTICHPTSPRCSACPIARACPRIGVTRSR